MILTIDRCSECGQQRGQAVDDASPADEDLAWAQRAAERLEDPDGLLCFTALARRYRRGFLDSVLQAATAVPQSRIRRSRAALFVALVQARAQRTDVKPDSRRPVF